MDVFEFLSKQGEKYSIDPGWEDEFLYPLSLEEPKEVPSVDLSTGSVDDLYIPENLGQRLVSPDQRRFEESKNVLSDLNHPQEARRQRARLIQMRIKELYPFQEHLNVSGNAGAFAGRRRTIENIPGQGQEIINVIHDDKTRLSGHKPGTYSRNVPTNKGQLTTPSGFEGKFTVASPGNFGFSLAGSYLRNRYRWPKREVTITPDGSLISVKHGKTPWKTRSKGGVTEVGGYVETPIGRLGALHSPQYDRTEASWTGSLGNLGAAMSPHGPEFNAYLNLPDKDKRFIAGIGGGVSPRGQNISGNININDYNLSADFYRDRAGQKGGRVELSAPLNLEKIGKYASNLSSFFNFFQNE